MLGTVLENESLTGLTAEFMVGLPYAMAIRSSAVFLPVERNGQSLPAPAYESRKLNECIIDLMVSRSALRVFGGMTYDPDKTM
ncbi:hypothetical protein B2D07_14250 [Desulfococcus multivorans]|jgi:hypothetical protein|nr:hypothetical protein B2D07_14250 [Desulfococcus multivorans]